MNYQYKNKYKAHQLKAGGHLIKFEILPKWNKIEPALVLCFDNHKPMPIREYKWDDYMEVLNNDENGRSKEIPV